MNDTDAANESEDVQVHYLNWDEKEERDDEFWEMDQIRHGEEDVDDLSHYRQPLPQVPDVDGPEEMWKLLNRGPTYFGGLDVHEERSMSVGDIVRIGDTYHIARAFGFDEVEINDAG